MEGTEGRRVLRLKVGIENGGQPLTLYHTLAAASTSFTTRDAATILRNSAIP